jgi:hypothetical protein
MRILLACSSAPPRGAGRMPTLGGTGRSTRSGRSRGDRQAASSHCLSNGSHARTARFSAPRGPSLQPLLQPSRQDEAGHGVVPVRQPVEFQRARVPFDFDELCDRESRRAAPSLPLDPCAGIPETEGTEAVRAGALCVVGLTPHGTPHPFTGGCAVCVVCAVGQVDCACGRACVVCVLMGGPPGSRGLARPVGCRLGSQWGCAGTTGWCRGSRRRGCRRGRPAW